jgi:hypothetical protein
MKRERHTTYQQDDKCLGPPTEEAHAGCSELPETKAPEVSVICLKISSATCCSFGNLQCQCNMVFLRTNLLCQKPSESCNDQITQAGIWKRDGQYLHIKKFSWLEIHDLEYHTQWKHRQSIRTMNTFFA